MKECHLEMSDHPAQPYALPRTPKRSFHNLAVFLFLPQQPNPRKNRFQCRNHFFRFCFSPLKKLQRVYRAIYDYEAQDSDEVGFTEGDLIIEVNSIDSGWMTGRVERTGLTGMLPANYVELVKI